MNGDRSETDHVGARLLSVGAHALRNHVATVRSVVRLVDDAEVAGALDEASRALQVGMERAVVLARMELDERPAAVQLTVDELVGFAARRARREGSDVRDAPQEAGEDAIVEVPGAWAERLVADLLHHAADAPTLSATAQDACIVVSLRERVAEPLDVALAQLAHACGGSLEWSDDHATLRLARAASVNAE